jgi:predicted membrane protein
MNTLESKKNLLSVVCSILLMAGGGLLLDRTLNVFYGASPAATVISSLLLSVFLYIAGTVLMERCTDKNQSRRSFAGINGGTVFALLLIAAGTLLLGFNTGYLPCVWKKFFFSLPMLILVTGIVCLCRLRFISGIIIAASGIFFLLSKATGIYPDNLPESFVSTFWPVLIIILGMLLFFPVILKHERFGRKRADECGNGMRGTDADGKINYRFVFSGAEQVILDPVFRGGHVEAIFGGMELDLRRTSLPEGDTFLHVRAICGGVVITAPDSWEIEIHPKSFAGGVDDARLKDGGRDKSRKLVIIAECAFGGVEVK